MTDRAAAAAVAVAVLAVVVLCGCGVPRAEAPLHTLTVPPGPPVPGEPGPTYEVAPTPPPVSWTGDGDELSVTTYGSSSCPTGPSDVEVIGEQELRVRIEEEFPDRDPCTADMAVFSAVVDLPRGISADEELTVRLRYGSGDEQTFVLPPAGD